MTDSPTLSGVSKVAAPWIVLITAFFLLGFFGWLTHEMFFNRLDQTELQWTRSMSIYSAIEAFALAAAGALLGVQVQSGRVQSAEARADAKEAEAKDSDDKAQKLEAELGGHRQTIDAIRQRLVPSGELGGSVSPNPATELEILRALVGVGGGGHD